MTMPEKLLEKTASSASLQVFARLAMIIASCALPFALFLLGRVLGTIDETAKAVQQNTIKLEVLDNNFKAGNSVLQEGLTRIQVQIADHETRIRVLERPISGPR